MQAIEFEREAIHRLPGIIAELFDEPAPADALSQGSRNGGADVIIAAADRQWAIQVKASSSPGTVAAAADQLVAVPAHDLVPVLVVPYMTPAGAKAAADRGLNWIDLSGNAHLRDNELYVWVQGRPNQFSTRGRPRSAFAPNADFRAGCSAQPAERAGPC